jgi:eukaryotic-like serine/threonine-protein kinase
MSEDEYIGRVLANKYELVRLLGRGGMGVVYEGRTQIGKRVAIKVLTDLDFARNQELVARFFREAQAAAIVESRHVVDVYDTGVDEVAGLPFLIMAYLSGEDLEQIVRRVGALNPFAAVRVASQAAAGLAKAHEAGIVHRDVKPANIFLAESEGESVVKILDFGIAKLSLDHEFSGPSSGALTKSGALLGTPLYMSPEQAQGLKSIDARTDVWSLGMCLYQALAGRLPFGDVDTVGKLIVEIVTHDVPPLEALAPWVPRELSAVVQHALERDPVRRIASARDLIAALGPFTNGGLALTPDLLTSTRQSLESTLVPSGPSLPPSPPSIPKNLSSSRTIPGDFGSAPTLTPLPASVTTPGSNREGAPAILATAGTGTSKALAFGVVALLALVVGGVAWRMWGGTSTTRVAGAEVPSDPQAASSAASASSTASAADGEKVGVLVLKMPPGFTVKVGGVTPGSDESHGASRLLENGNLELHGEFQSKFVVAVYDKSGTRVLAQDVYLYDNKLDPEVVDTSVGEVSIPKPKHTVGGSASVKALAPRPPGSALPARF